MFGGTWGQNNNNQQQQQQPQQQQTGFGQPANTFGQPSQAPSAFGTTTGAFGASNPAPLFGASATQPRLGFGAPATNPVNPTNNTSTFGAFGAPATNTQQPAQTGFGAFGASTGPKFGATNDTSIANTASPPYSATQERDTTATGSTMLHYQSISCMPAYRNFSFEELRVGDYIQGRKTAAGTGTTGGFGGGAFGASNTAAPTGTGLFGQPQNTTQPAGGGLFGASNAGTGGFGAFGANATATNPTQSTGFGTFGQPAQNNTTGGGLFGAQPAAPTQGFGTFGQSQQNQQPQQSGFGTFGQPAANTNDPNKSAFGAFGQPNPAPAATGFGTGGAFGQNTGGGGLFGQPAANQQQPAATTGFGAFGANNTAANNNQPKPLFGGFGQTAPATQTGTGFGAFGQPAQPVQTGGLFGQPAAQPTNIFGQPNNAATTTTNTGGGIFGNLGQNQQQQQPPAAGASIFGNAQPAAQNNTGATGFGLFGAKPAINTGANAAPGASTTGTGGFGLFGQSAQNQQQQQQPQQQQNAPVNPFGGGLFGSTNNTQNTSGTGGGLFGNASATGTTGGGLFGQKPAGGGLFGIGQNQNQNQAAAPAAGGGVLSGGTTGGGGLFGGGLFGSNNQSNSQSGFGGGLFGQQNQQQQQPQPTLTASIDQPILTNTFSGQAAPSLPPLFASGSSSLFNRSSTSEEKKKPSNFWADVPFRTVQPRIGIGHTYSPGTGLRGFSATSSVGRGGNPFTNSALGNSVNPFAVPLPPSPLPATRGDGLLSSAASSFGSSASGLNLSARPSPKKLMLTKKVTAADGQAFANGGSGRRDTGIRFDAGLGVAAREKEREREASAHDKDRLRSTPIPRTPSKSKTSKDASEGEYWSRPPVDELVQMNYDQLSHVKNFTVGRTGYGEITFLEEVDLTTVGAVRDIPGGLVVFLEREAIVYPDDSTKPEPGQGLNVPAEVKLDRVWAVDKGSKEPIKDENHVLHRKMLRKLMAYPDTKFLGFDMGLGRWRFEVAGF